MDMNAAVRFIFQHGNPTEQARLRFIMSGEPASPETRLALLEGQRRDGGWSPPWAVDYSSLDATCFRLAQARQLGMGAGDSAIQHALRFIEERQASDGSWSEDASVASFAPPWAVPGDISARIYLTSNCAYWLALLVPGSESLEPASASLLPHLQPDGMLPSFLHAHWLCGGFWWMLGETDPAEVIFTHILSQVPNLSISGLAWLVIALSDAGLPVTHELIRQAILLLIRNQQPDGRWSSEDGPARDVHATLEAMQAVRLGMQPRQED